MPPHRIVVRPAEASDRSLVRAFITELADYERLSHEVSITDADVEAALFGPAPRAFCDIADVDGQSVGFALWYYTFSTFEGRFGIWLEDLFVRPNWRGTGAGKALMARLARRCVDEGLARLEWAVLDWNTPSIAFYDALGAETENGWTDRRLSGEALARLARTSA
jgi:GNAT superfamily N-acetyltransferase